MSTSRIAILEVGSQRTHVIGARAVIGRGPEADIRLDDPMVALAHAELVPNPDGSVGLRDLGSRHGTFVGQQRVQHATLRDGDTLLVGPVELRIAVAPSGDDADELRRLRAVVELSRVIGVEHDIDVLIERVLTTLLALLPSSRGAVVVYDPQSRTPRWTATRDRAGGHPSLTLSSSVLAQVMLDPRPLLRTELIDDGALERSASLLAQDIRSLMVVPLLYQDTRPEWLGVVHLDCQGEGARFQPADLELVVAVASQAALAIKNALLVTQIQTVRDEQWRRLERVVHDLPVGVIVLDDRQRCVLANPWVTDRSPLLGPLVTGQVVDRIGGIEPTALPAPGAPITITVGTAPRARTLTVATAIAGDGSETVVVLTDVTEQRAHEERAAHQERLMLLGQLAGGIAHDFNNLVVVMINNASFLEAEVASEDAREDARQIIRAANRAAELTRQLLAFSRREAARPVVLAVGKLVRGLERTLSRTLGERIQLVTRIADDLPPVRIDPDQLEQVIMNLVVNARDAMPDGGRVTLSVSRQTPSADDPPLGPDVVLEVADVGGGIAPELLPHVFEPYFTTKPFGKGTGLGLAMVQGIVQQAGGTVTVASDPGCGAVFRIHLPCAVPDPIEAAAIAAPAPSATVLVVDDDDSVRRLSERILKKAGYVVMSALSGPEALELALHHDGAIDLLLSDMVMPGMTGRELADALSEVRPTVKVLFMSGYDRGMIGPGQALLAKPFDRDGLLGAVAGILGG